MIQKGSLDSCRVTNYLPLLHFHGRAKSILVLIEARGISLSLTG
jgi:hypothetical protein